MDITPQAISAIGTSALGITQLLKFAGLPSKHAPPVLAVLSFGSVMMWVYKPFWFEVMVATSIVTMTASGVYGFATRGAQPSPPAKDGVPSEESKTADADTKKEQT